MCTVNRFPVNLYSAWKMCIWQEKEKKTAKEKSYTERAYADAHKRTMGNSIIINTPLGHTCACVCVVFIKKFTYIAMYIRRAENQSGLTHKPSVYPSLNSKVV